MNTINSILNQLQPFATIITAILSIGVLGLLIRLWLQFKSVVSERVNVLEERRKLAEEQLVISEKCHDKEKEELKNKLSELLSGQIPSIFSSNDSFAALNVKDEIRISIQSVLSEMKNFEEKSHKIQDPSWHLEMAKGFTATGEWLSAANHYEKYLKYDDQNWEIHFYKGVALANCSSKCRSNIDQSEIDYPEGGKRDTVMALRAYSDAIALMPENADDNMRARLYDYRGAVLKRLNRVKEAESDLLLALEFADRPYELIDITYNLACVYAMSFQRDKMISQLKKLVTDPAWQKRLKLKKSFFQNYWNDSEFQELIKLSNDE